MLDARMSLESLELLSLEKSSEKRRQLLNAVTDVFLVTQDQQSAADGEMFSDVMERVAYELEVEARAQLSERIAGSEKISRRLIVRMANDEIAVARPVLERSRVLQDTDLIDIIRNRSQDHMHSIAGRETVSQNVSGELVDRGNDNVITRLTGNHGADISESSFTQIASRANENKDILDALKDRPDVPATIMDSVKAAVADRLKSEMSESHPHLDDNFIGALVDRCAEDIDLEYCQESINELNRLHESGGVKEETIVQLARANRLPELVHCLGLITGIDNWSVSQCLLRAELQALAILCKSAHFQSSTFLALAELRMQAGGVQSTAVAKLMRDYDALAPATAERIMRFLKVRLKLLQQEQAKRAGAA